MSNNDSFQLADISKNQHPHDDFDLKKVISLVTSNWDYFLIAFIIAMSLAFLYSTYTVPTYRVSANILITEGKKGGLMGSSQFLEGMSLGAGSQNLDNQIIILASKNLIRNTLNELPFEIEYYKRKLFSEVSLYTESPIKIIPEIADSLPRDIVFRFKYLENNLFSLKAESNNLFKLNTQASFGDIIKTPGGRFHIEPSTNNWSDKVNDDVILFVFHSREKLVEKYKKRLKIEKVSKDGTILSIYLVGSNKTMNMDFLKKLTDIFLLNSLDKKNQEAVRTIQFIDDQLIGISDSLVITENKLQQFRSTHRVMDLSAQGQVIIDQAMNLENQKARLGIEANYYNYLADYLAKDNIGQAPIAPATLGITDPGLTRLVADLADIQSQFYSKSLGEKNPLQTQLAQRLRNTKEALRETLNGVRRSNNMAMNEISEQIRTVNAQASALPVTERQLLGIERKYKLNDELYTFLLEKRAGAQIQKASNLPDNEVIDPPEADILPVKPNKSLVFVFALFASFVFPFLWILIAGSFSNKIRGVEDIKQITDFPIVGYIPHISQSSDIVVFDDQSSKAAEAFRSLRSRMQFYTKGIKAPVILITSSIPEEGKSFMAINMASSYSLIGKKTVLVGFDLRKPNTYTDFGIGNDQGVSSWLIGKAEFTDIIRDTSYDKLTVIPTGPLSPNPSELIVSDRTEELIKYLKDNYECIIIDSSPLGTVSDAFQLSLLADVSILIVRQNKTIKGLFDNTSKELRNRKIKNILVVVNDLGPEYKKYSYAGKYSSYYGKTNT